MIVEVDLLYVLYAALAAGGVYGVSKAMKALRRRMKLRAIRDWSFNDRGEIIGEHPSSMSPERWNRLMDFLLTIIPQMIEWDQRDLWISTVENLRSISSRWGRDGASGHFPEALSIATTYLPRTALQYGTIPYDIRSRVGRRGKTPSEALTEQLTLLNERSVVLRSGVFDEDVAGFDLQGEIVRGRYEKSEMERMLEEL